MKFPVVSVEVIGLLALVMTCVFATPIKEASDDTDPVDRFAQPLFENMRGILKLMETGQKVAVPTTHLKNQDPKYANSEYTISEPIPDKDGRTNSAPSFLATALTGLLKTFLGRDPELARLAAAATDPNLIKYITGMIRGSKITDLMQLVLRSPGVQKLYSDAANGMPLFGHLKDTLERVNPQDRVLGEVLTGKKPSLSDMKAVVENDQHYSIKKLIKGMKEDKQFQDFLAMTLDKHPDVHDALKLLTDKNLQLNGDLDPKYQDKYSVTSSDPSKNKELVNFGTAILFGVENFSPLMNLAKEFLKKEPSLPMIVSTIFKLNTSMLTANDAPQQ